MTRPPSISIGTWNLDWAYSGQAAEYGQVLSEHLADIWVLTETRDEVTPLGAPYGAHAPPRRREDVTKWTPNSRWVSIWSRWPLQSVAVEDDSRRVVCARIDVETMPLLVWGAVFPWGGDTCFRGKSEKRRAIERQLEELLRLRAAHSDCRLVVAGDFNQYMAPQKSADTLQKVIERGLRDLRMTCVTTPARLEPRWPHKIVDHIAISDDIADQFEVRCAWPPSDKLTDHGGIVVSRK